MHRGDLHNYETQSDRGGIDRREMMEAYFPASCSWDESLNMTKGNT